MTDDDRTIGARARALVSLHDRHDALVTRLAQWAQGTGTPHLLDASELRRRAETVRDLGGDGSVGHPWALTAARCRDALESDASLSALSADVDALEASVAARAI